MPHVEGLPAARPATPPSPPQPGSVSEAVAQNADIGQISEYLAGNPRARGDVETALVDAGRFTDLYILAQANASSAQGAGSSTLGAPGVTDIYIGGGGDGKTEIVQSFENNLPLEDGRTTQYFEHHQLEEAVAFANERLAAGDTLNIIGHSWGGDTAVRLAASVDGEVNLLVGIDPVSKPFSDSFHSTTERPDNVRTVVVTDAQAPGFSTNEVVEWFGETIGGGIPPAFQDADVRIDTVADHAAFLSIYEADGMDGQSARDLVNEVYASVVEGQ